MLVSLGRVTALMLAMATKHFCADFLFQTDWIARGKAAERGWVTPLLLHAFGHAIITLGIAIAFFPRAWWLAPLEWVIHAIIDRSKADFGRWAHIDVAKTEFWWLLGFDQFLHQVTNAVIVAVMLALG